MAKPQRGGTAWLPRKAARSPSPFLGVMYANGMGVAGSSVRAHLWFNLAARRGNAAAAKNLEIIAGRMTSQQIDKALGLAAEWQAK
jgi:TPR repeat protein